MAAPTVINPMRDRRTYPLVILNAVKNLETPIRPSGTFPFLPIRLSGTFPFLPIRPSGTFPFREGYLIIFYMLIFWWIRRQKGSGFGEKMSRSDRECRP